jgi:hypothetical protein
VQWVVLAAPAGTDTQQHQHTVTSLTLRPRASKCNRTIVAERHTKLVLYYDVTRCTLASCSLVRVSAAS